MGREAEVVAGLVRDFEKEYPEIRVDLQSIPMTAAHEKLLTAFAANSLPDVCQLGNTWLSEFALLDTLEPLQPYVAKSNVVMPADYFLAFGIPTSLLTSFMGYLGMWTHVCCSTARIFWRQPGTVGL